MRKTSRWLVASVILLSAQVHATDQPNQRPPNPEGIDKRCKEDIISDIEKARGRNAWALKCGYIKNAAFKAEFDHDGMYMTFSNDYAPTNPNADCIAGLKKLCMCNLGCFALGQPVVFGAHTLPTEQAYAQGIKTITALHESSNFSQLRFANEPIASYTSGNHKGVVVQVQSEEGKALQVTPNHPMVDAKGHIVRADKLTIGMQLMTQEGPRKITSLASLPYEGLVWNIKPKSTATKANIHIAAGFLTGSLRFQNQWALDAHRLYNRLAADSSSF